MAARLERLPLWDEAVELPVDDHLYATVFVADRLRARRQVDNRQASVAKRGACERKDPFAVRAAMDQLGAHRPNPVGLAVGRRPDDAANATH